MRKAHKRNCNIIAMVICMPEEKTVAQKPIEMCMTGFEVVEKIAKPCATSARIIVPKDWIGKRVRVVRIDP
jgi:putative transposon-encoded protein